MVGSLTLAHASQVTLELTARGFGEGLPPAPRPPPGSPFTSPYASPRSPPSLVSSGQGLTEARGHLSGGLPVAFSALGPSSFIDPPSGGVGRVALRFFSLLGPLRLVPPSFVGGGMAPKALAATLLPLRWSPESVAQHCMCTRVLQVKPKPKIPKMFYHFEFLSLPHKRYLFIESLIFHTSI